jgi:UMF1 family MFS transporter
MTEPARGPATRPGRLSVSSWVVYDLANTIFALGVVGLYFPDWLLAAGLPDSALATVQVSAAAFVIFLGPWAGARTDASGARLPTLVVTTVIAVIATFFLGTGPVPLTLILLGVAVVAVNTGSVVYDALLVDVSTPENRGWVSGLGVGVGYFGSFVGLGIGTLAIDVLGWGHDGTFRALAIAFLIFAVPAFVFVEEGPRRVGRAPGPGEVMARVLASWRLASNYPGVIRFLVGRFFYTDAINTLLTGFLAIFVIDELGLDRSFFTLLMGVAITAAVIGGLGAGRLLDRLSPLRLLRVVLVIWVIAISMGIAASVTGVTRLAWMIGPLGGVALGATWASDRLVMTRVSPPSHLGEFYGLYATVGRFATIAGPLTWAIIVDVIGLGRNVAMGALAAFIVIGWWVLRGVDDAPRRWGPGDALEVSGTRDADRT